MSNVKKTILVAVIFCVAVVSVCLAQTRGRSYGGGRRIGAASGEREGREERRKILFGTVVDDKGNAVADAQVCGSYAHYGQADENGDFALVISPTDGSNSLGPADFPMFVWAFRAGHSYYGPHRVAWTIIRHPQGRHSREKDVVVEQTHQGVKLVIADVNDLALIPGDPGELIEEDSGPIVRDILLVTGPASVITGRVTNASGQPIADATVKIEDMEIQLGSSQIAVSDLDQEWKAGGYASVRTDDSGRYSLKNLPASWYNIGLKAEADGYRTDEEEFDNSGGNVTEGCDFQLVSRMRTSQLQIQPDRASTRVK